LVREQDAHILDGRDQVILDLLTPEPPPARTFEVVIIGRISKTALDQVLASFEESPGTGQSRVLTQRLINTFIQDTKRYFELANGGVRERRFETSVGGPLDSHQFAAAIRATSSRYSKQS